MERKKFNSIDFLLQFCIPFYCFKVGWLVIHEIFGKKLVWRMPLSMLALWPFNFRSNIRTKDKSANHPPNSGISSTQVTQTSELPSHIEYISEVQTHCADSQLHCVGGRHCCLGGVRLWYAPQPCEGATRRHVEAQGTRVFHSRTC